MSIRRLGIFVVAVGLGGGLATVEAAPELFTDFEGKGKELAERLAQHERLTVESGAGVDGSAGLRADYVGGERGSDRIVVRHDLGGLAKAMTLCYDVRFAPDFQFVRGGKLHGLGPEDPITGGNPMKPGGWSTRVMFEDGGQLRSYVYHQDKEGKYGESVGTRKPVFQPGKWHSVSLYVRLNSRPDQADGAVHIWVDGKHIVEHRGLRFRARNGKDTLIRQFMFSTFHGGHKPSWAPTNADGEFITVRAWFDNIGVYEGKHVRG